jgi:hypothetical protein
MGAMKILSIAVILLLSAPAAASLQDEYSVKQMCRQSAEKFASENTLELQTYNVSINHYNKKKNICFAIIEVDMYNDTEQKNWYGAGFDLYDVDEGVLYGSYFQTYSDKDTFTDSGNKRSRIYHNPPSCVSNFETSPATLTHLCKDKNAFRSHLELHMRDGESQ